MTTITLNLSRKWRSQHFDHIVGQELAVRILKNSLYLGHFFPVYLFAGQRGCGKTSTARIFAAAVNCQALPSFQKDPKQLSVPCLVCVSCVAMRDGNHPDFIEIDAASHTGVDNIRAVIESSSLLPIMGRKRVYLIDEAHMLSKAAFNAALKILEEPPSTALFILATTNAHKIIDTVRSRCFQLFFTPIAHNALKNHLTVICKNEKIAYTDDALDIIVSHTEGSARDALNLLEQVRFSSSVVNKNAVLSLLGHIDDQHIMQIIQLTMQGAATELVRLLHTLGIDQHKAEFIWQRMIILLRALLWIKYGVKPHELVASVTMLQEHAQQCHVTDVHRMIEALYVHEELLVKTTMQHIVLEMILLGLCYKNKKKTDNGDGSAPCALATVSDDGVLSDGEIEDEEEEDDSDNEAIPSYEQQWENFIVKTATLNDPLLCSVFKQARFIAYAVDVHVVSIELSKDFILFQDWLQNSKTLWQPLLQELFGTQTVLDVQFTGKQKIEVKTPRSNETRYHIPAAKKNISVMNNNSLHIDVTDENVWKKASMVLRHFPGTITEIRENNQ
jgi:DNA polymerase-3 subunit gamma/tau